PRHRRRLCAAVATPVRMDGRSSAPSIYRRGGPRPWVPRDRSIPEPTMREEKAMEPTSNTVPMSPDLTEVNRLNRGCYLVREALQQMDELKLQRRMDMGSIESVYLLLQNRLALDGDGEYTRLGFNQLNAQGKIVFATAPISVATIDMLSDPERNPEKAIERK